ncbi:MAG: protein kinase, partial [Abditibacteriota bacterium]|nr:protein kinase [Abditibacteriota bacterium]
MINKVADKRYRIEELFSEDWTGELYKGFDLKEKKSVFIRVYKEKYTYDDIFIDNFEVELGRIYRLNDMLVLRAKDGGLVENRIYCVTEAVEGKTLRRILKNSISGQLSFGRAVSILTKIANLLDYVHSRGIVHGDIRPDNIIVDDNGTAYLTGFAFA